MWAIMIELMFEKIEISRRSMVFTRLMNTLFWLCGVPSFYDIMYLACVSAYYYNVNYDDTISINEAPHAFLRT